jgi:hypothetical protein
LRASAPAPLYFDGYFNGDFDTGDLSQWLDFHDAQLSLTPPGVQVVSSPTFEDTGYAAKIITTNAADTSIWGDATVLWEGNGYNSYDLPYLQNGQTTWFRFQVAFPNGTNPSFPGEYLGPDGTISLIEEWHVDNGAIPTAYSSFIGVTNEGEHTLIFQTRGGSGEGEYNRFHQQNGGGSHVPLQFNHWYDIVNRITFGPTAASGSIEWYIDDIHQGTHSVPTIGVAADQSIPGVGHEVGHYRGPTFYGTDTIYIDGVRAGPTRASVSGWLGASAASSSVLTLVAA